MYLSELKETTNTLTGKKFYFIRCCDYWKRVSKADYEEREGGSYRQDSFLTVRKGHMLHNTKTVYLR